MHHAADHVANGNALMDSAARVHHLQSLALLRTAKALQEPPGHAIHGCQHDGMRAKQWRNLPRHIGHGRGFDGEHDQVLHTKLLRLVAGSHRENLRPVAACQAQAMLAQGGQGRAARQQADLATRAGQ